MSLLSDAQITSMRRTAERALPDVCEIQRLSSASDGGGGSTDSWQPHLSTPCRLSPVAGGESNATPGDRIEDEATHVVTVPAGTDVIESDRLQIAGTTYEIQLVRMRGAWALTTRIECKESA